MNKLTIRAAAARQKMTDVRAKGLRRSLQEDGAIDLASIMVGVLVIGIVGGVIAATVFAVIPWSQDKAAEQALDSVATAESVVYAQSAGEGAGKYLGTEGTGSIFEADGLKGTDGLLQKSDTILVTVTDAAPGVAAGYKAYSLSATGTVYSSDNLDPSTAKANATLPAGFEAVGGKIVAK